MDLISEKLSAWYTKAEDKYFDTLDFLDSKGIPVYKYSDFFEEKGIPSFVVTISLILLLLILIMLFFASQNGATTEMIINLKDASGNNLTNVKVSLFDEKSNTFIFKDKDVSSGDKLTIPQYPQGTKLKLSATKDGYQSYFEEITLGKEKIKKTINLSKNFEGIEAQLLLIDSETKSKIKNATVLASWEGTEYQFSVDANGLYKATNFPGQATVLLKIKADGYNDLTQEASFLKEVEKTLMLIPSTAGFVGKAALIITVSDVEGNSIENAKVSVYKKETNDLLLQDFTKSGAVAGSIQSGIPLRVTVQKEGYLNFDSDISGDSYTIRKSEDKIDIELAQGGTKLVVNVRDVSLGLSLDGSIVQLFSLDGVRINRAVTNVNGAEFSGLDPESNIIITAFKEDYIPQRKEILVGSTDSEEFFLTRALAANSLRLDVYSIDSFGDSVNGTKVNVSIIDDTNKIPYGIDELESNIAGYSTFIAEKGKTYEIISETETMIGNKIVEVTEETTESKVYVELTKKPNIVEMKFLDPRGGNIFGDARVEALDGTLLYDYNITNSRIFFNSMDKETVEVSVILEDENKFVENVYVKGKDYIEVIVYNKTASELAPTIEYIGLENEFGETVNGITPNEFYLAKFSVSFPLAASSAGVHFRAGNDEVENIESDNFALFDLSMQGAENYYSKTFNPKPSPGNETLDRSNVGVMGEANKWIEGVVTKPSGTYTVKVKVRASQFILGKAKLHYRAWASVGNEFYRNPEDQVLETNVINEEKSTLYAETNLLELNMYESLPECSGNICITTNFIDEEERVYSETNFEAVIQKTYALEVEFSSKESDYLQVSVVSPQNLQFVGTQSGTFSFLKSDVSDLNYAGEGSAGFASRDTQQQTTSTSTESKSTTTLSLTKDSKQKIRFYFRGTSEGVGEIKLSAIGNDQIEKDLSFNIVSQKELLVELSEQTVMLGKNFTVKVLDKSLQGITDALIKIMDRDGKVVKSVLGDNTEGKGMSGEYRIQNDLGVGLYTVEVSVPKYATKAVPLLVTSQKILTFNPSIKIKLPVGQKTAMVSEVLKNNSDFSVTNINTETSESENYKITLLTPMALNAQEQQTVQIQVEFIGEEAESADEMINLTINGMVEGVFLTQVNSSINAIYNEKLDESCLKIVPSSLTMYLIGNAGTTETETIEVTNNCEQALALDHRVKEKTKRSGVLVASENIMINEGETKILQVTANNLIDRTYSKDQSYSYEITWDSNEIKKRLNVTINLINPLLALSYPGQITLWLAQTDISRPAAAAQPLFVTNVSQFPVEGISFSQSTEYATGGNVKITVEPGGSVSLGPKQTMNPPKVVYATASTTISEPVRGQILINGKMGSMTRYEGTDNYDYSNNYYGDDGYSGSSSTTPINYYAPKNVSTGYTNSDSVLGVIDVIVYYSGINCLKVSPYDILDYTLSVQGAQITKRIKLQNTCAEPVTITGVSATSKDIGFFIPTITIPNDGSEVVANLAIATARNNLNLKGYKVTVHGITGISQTMISAEPLSVNITSGDVLSSTSKVISGIEVNVCGEEQKTTIDVPKPARGKDCAEGYCDAKEAAEYLSMKLDKVIQSAQSKAITNQNQSQSFSCLTRGFCTFGELGIQTETFDLYLQNDILSAGVVSEQINKTSGYSSSFRSETNPDYSVEMTTISQNVLEMLAGSGYTGKIFVDNRIQGCGYYRLTINGAFNAAGGTVEFQNPTIVISSTDPNNPRVLTKECTDNIINITNFTPIDKEYTLSQNRGTWLTSVESESGLKEIAEKVAEKQFGAKERAATGPGNKIILKEGALSEALAEMCISPGTGKKTITVTINSLLDVTKDTEKEKLVEQLTKLITEALNANNFSGENCLVKSATGYNCVMLKETGDTAEIRMEVPNKTMLIGTKETEVCTNATIFGRGPELVNLEIDKGEEKFEGIRKITVYENVTTNLTQTPTTQNNTPQQPTTQVNPQNTSNVTQNQTMNVSATLPQEDIEQKPTEPTTTTTKIYGKKLFEINYDTTNQNPTIDEKILLLPNTGNKRNENPFKKEITICAELLQSTDNLPTHAQAALIYGIEGSEFIIKAISKTSGKSIGTTKEDGTITLRTNTIHPDDLVLLLSKNTLKTGEENPYYITVTWNNDVHIIESFDKYRQGLIKLGKLDGTKQSSEEDGLQITDSSYEEINKARSAAVGNYVISCASTSLACNGVVGGLMILVPGGQFAGVTKMTVAGIQNVALDCIIPAVTVFGADLRAGDALGIGEEAYSLVSSILKRVPVVGDWIEEKLDPKVSDEVNFLSSSLTAISARTLTKLPQFNSSLHAADEIIKKASESVDAAAKARSAAEIATQNASGINLSTLQDSLNNAERTVKKLTTELDIMKIENANGRYNAPSAKKIANKVDALTKAEQNYTKAQSALEEGKRLTDAAKSAQEAAEKAIKESSEAIGKTAAESNATVKKIIKSIDDIDAKINNGTSFPTDVDIIENGKTTTKTLNNIDDAKAALKTAQTQADDAIKTANKGLGRVRTASKARGNFTYRKMLAGIGCSILSNYFGMQAYNEEIKDKTKDISKDALLIGDNELEKNVTYRMILVVRGSLEVQLERIDTTEKRQKMDEELKINETTKKAIAEVLSWKQENDTDLAPYQRKLSHYDFEINPEDLRLLLDRHTDVSKSDKKTIIERIRNPNSQIIIQNYTKNEELKIRKDQFDALEIWVAGIIGVYGKNNSALETEAKEGKGIIRTKTEELMNVLIEKSKNLDTAVITLEDAKKLTNNESEARVLHTIINAMRQYKN